MNCKQGDMAWVVEGRNAGKIVRCGNLHPIFKFRYSDGITRETPNVWEVTPCMEAWDGTKVPLMRDEHLRPLRNPGEDEKDEMLRPLPESLPYRFDQDSFEQAVRKVTGQHGLRSAKE